MAPKSHALLTDRSCQIKKMLMVTFANKLKVLYGHPADVAIKDE
jgi:hypothetical protein